MAQPIPPQQPPDPRLNLLLRQLDPAVYDALVSKGKVVAVKLRQHLHQQNAMVDAVYFPLTCMVSLIVMTDTDQQVELATLGKESVVGAAEALEQQSALTLHLVQLPGWALRVPVDTLQTLAQEHPSLASLLQKHQYALLKQILQGAACNRVHGMEERCARWLLRTHDQADEDTFPITQEFLSYMLGVRRATVNVATGMLKKAGFIRYVRGIVTIVDRAGLETAACPCYQTITKAYEAILTPTHS